MEKVTGIKSVDFKIKAVGHGVVNWNGSPTLMTTVDGKDKKINNHSMPKLRGYKNIKGYWDDGNPKYKHTEDVDFANNPLYISQNCIRHHLFKSEGFFDLQSKEVALNMDKLLCSITGLVRGYVVPATEHKRTSALLLTDFIDSKNNGNYEQLSKSGSKEKKVTKSGGEKSTSMFSKTTFGDTEYTASGSISIELLQFISLSSEFSRQAMMVDNESEAKSIAKKISCFINVLGNVKNADAVYHKNYVRKGSIFNSGESGILLNDIAIEVLVKEMIRRLENLSIRQAKGYMYVDSIQVDFNDSSFAKDMFRIETNPASVLEEKGDREFSVYFEGR